MRSIALLTQKRYPFGGGPEPYRVAAADPFSSDRELESCK
jgi:hypothetical protein